MKKTLKKVLQINSTANSGSTGRCAEDIGRMLIEKGIDSFIAYGRTANNSESELIKSGNKADIAIHLLKTRLFDRHGFGSVRATKALVKKIDLLDPDLVHLHNIHGYYLNVRILFEYLKEKNKPVVWTFHDCWPFTGHCSYFDTVNCCKWQTECQNCPNKRGYPSSWFIDNSRGNYRIKKEGFNGLEKMALVSPSEWLAGHLRNSFLKGYDIRVINNGVNLEKFRPVNSDSARAKYKLNKKYVLGVASTWTDRKGLGDFVRLRKILDNEFEIVLVGLSRTHSDSLLPGMTGVKSTKNTDELAALYSGAEVFVNPTYADNFPSVNLEALACGTPVITYNTGGSPEAIDDITGLVVEKGNINGINDAIKVIMDSPAHFTSGKCRERAETKYSVSKMSEEYLNLYKVALSTK